MSVFDITVAWDVDDVLNDLMQVWFEEKWLKEHVNCTVTYSQLKNNPPHEQLGVPLEEYLSSLDAFRLSALYSTMMPLSEVKAWFMRHGDHFRHVAVTAVPARAAHVSAAWVIKEFGRWIRSYHFVPSFRARENLPVYDESKQTVLKRLNSVDVFVDDSQDNLKNIDGLGIKGILFPRPWNTSRSTILGALEDLTDYLYLAKSTKYKKAKHDD